MNGRNCQQSTYFKWGLSFQTSIDRYKDLVEWLSSFNLVLLAIIKKKASGIIILAKSDATLYSIVYQEMIIFQITKNNSVSVDTLL